MKNMRYKWLLLRGYRVVRVIRVNNTWDGEHMYYSTEILLRKGIQYKTIKIKADVADELRKEITAS